MITPQNVIAVFAVIGAAFVVVSIAKGGMVVFGIIRDLAETLKQAVGIAKELRSDFQFLRVLASGQQAAVQAREEAEAEMLGRGPAAPTPFPTPYLERFQTKPPEPEAPPERPEQVDVTASEEEVQQEDNLEYLRTMGFKTEALEEEFKAGRGVETE